jgi:hypothetical protein
MALTYNIRPGWRVAQIDRTRFYLANDAKPCDEQSNRTYRSREEASARATQLNATEKGEK